MSVPRRSRDLLPRATGALLVAMALGALLLACRPPIAAEGGDDGASPGGTPEPSATPAPAVALKPKDQTSVSVRLFRMFNAADAALQYAQALDSYADSNLVIDIAPPIAGYDPWSVEPAADAVTLWVGSIADAAAAKAKGVDLEAVGEVTGRDATVLALPAADAGAPLAGLKGTTILADSAASAASLQAALAAAGIAPADVTIVLPDDPSMPFDPTPLLDGSGTYAGATVSVYDGWARIQEGLAANGETPDAWVQQPLHPADAPLLGELIWAQKADVADPALGPAITAFLGVVAQSQIACSQGVEDCAGAASAQSDRTPEGLMWSIDQLDRLLFPAPDGIAHIDQSAWDRTIDAMAAAGIAGASDLTFTNDSVDAVLAALGPSLDVYGKGFVPRDDLPLIPAPDANGTDATTGTDPGGSAAP